LRLSANVIRLNVATTNVNSLATTLQRNLPDDCSAWMRVAMKLSQSSDLTQFSTFYRQLH